MSLPLADTIKALLRLLSDPDEKVARAIHHQLVSLGTPALANIESAMQAEPAIAHRLAEIREDILFSEVQTELARLWAGGGKHLDLEAGALLIAKWAYPDLSLPTYRRQLDKLAERVQERLRPNESLETTTTVLNRVLFRDEGFQGNRQDYYDPENSFLNRVLDRRMGIPISLSVLYLLVGQRVNLPVAGVGMPGHFLIKIVSSSPAIFVDCFNDGLILQEQDCENFLKSIGIGFDPAYLEPVSSSMILARMLRNLIGIYRRRQMPDHVDRLHALMTIVEHPSDE